jgi:1,4-dihydroxy-2-naphthoyl-CoA hydrolase
MTPDAMTTDAATPDAATTDATVTGATRLDAASLEHASAFVEGAGLVVDEITGSKVTGHIRLGAAHHTPWGIVHGGVYATAIESAASIGACTAVADRQQVAVGLTNTTHFLRALSAGTVMVEALALYQGRTHQLWRADITDESHRLVAHGEVRLQNVKAQPAESSASAVRTPVGRHTPAAADTSARGEL